MKSLIETARHEYHQRLIDEGILTLDAKGVPSNADSASVMSVKIARALSEQLRVLPSDKAKGQTSGAKFEAVNVDFIKATFPNLQNLRPGKWHIV